ncbi:MAG: transposase [Luteolibacter sp.]
MFLDPEKPIDKRKGNLPHWHQDDTWVFVTWRLADSLPEEVVAKISNEREEWERSHPKPWDSEDMKEYNRLFTLRFESLLDDCHGSCCLRDPMVRKVVTGSLHHFDGDRYDLDCYVAMPNHVHVLFSIREGHSLSEIMHGWKSFTAHEIRKIIGGEGALWQREYWDRLMRSQKHFDWVRRYIEENSVNLSEGSFDFYDKEKGSSRP